MKSSSVLDSILFLISTGSNAETIYGDKTPETFVTKKVSGENFFIFFSFVLLLNQPIPFFRMSLQLLFDPVLQEDIQDFEHFSFINQRFQKHQGAFPDLDKVDIAIVGILEDRGNPGNEGAHSGADAIRRALYGLRASHATYKVADLGNLRPGETLEDSHLRLKEVVRTLLEHNVLPILIGGTHDHSLAVIKAYEELGRKITFLNVDSRSDTEPTAQLGMAHHHISKILTKHKDVLNRYVHVGYQTYLVDENILAAIDQHHYFKMRLGELRDDFKGVEPIVRSADFLSFDISSIRISEAPANAYGFPYGLTAEEACQIAWYAGCSRLLSVFGIFELNPGLDYREITANTIGTMIWYVIEGFYNRQDDLTFSPSETIRYQVLVPGFHEHDITFYKGLKSGKWWMQLPPVGEGGHPEMLPCREEDYILALSGEVPSRWINQLFSLS
jgi:formiminoglutamase